MRAAVFNFIKIYFPILVITAAFVWASFAICFYRAQETPPGTIVIRIGHWQLESGVRIGLDELGREYSELRVKRGLPPVRIVQDAIPESVYGQWVTTQLMGGTAPDILEIGGLPGNVILSYYKRYFMPVSQYIGKPNPYNKGSELEDTPLRQTFKDGMKTSYVPEIQEFMTFPLSQQAVRLFYNKTLLKKLTGLDSAPGNYRKFLEVCEKIAGEKDERGVNYIPIAGSKYTFDKWAENMFDVITYKAIEKADFNRDGTVGNDELFVAFKSGRVDFKYKPFEAKFKMIREVTKYFQPGFTGLTRDESVFLFSQRKGVFIATGTWEARGLKEQTEGKFELGICDFPCPGKDDPYYGDIVVGPRYENPQNTFPFAITKTSAHPDIAADFLLFLAGRKQNEKLNRIVGWIPGVKGTVMDPFFKDFEPHLKGVYPSMNFFLGGETGIKWLQLYSLYQVNQISYEDMAREFESFYKGRGMLDYDESRKDWRRRALDSERFLSGLRASAMSRADGAERSDWIRYRSLINERQLGPEIYNAMQDIFINNSLSVKSDPYEYPPEVTEKIKDKIKKSLERMEPGK